MNNCKNIIGTYNFISLTNTAEGITKGDALICRPVAPSHWETELRPGVHCVLDDGETLYLCTVHRYDPLTSTLVHYSITDEEITTQYKGDMSEAGECLMRADNGGNYSVFVVDTITTPEQIGKRLATAFDVMLNQIRA